MIALATTRVDVLRGDTTDQFADPIDDNTVDPHLEDVPMSVVEQRRRVNNPTDGTPRVVRYVTGRAPHGTDVAPGDRIRDRRTAVLYMVESVDQPQHPVLASDLRMDLKKIN